MTACRWVRRADRPAWHDEDCSCGACWSQLAAVPDPEPEPTQLVLADWSCNCGSEAVPMLGDYCDRCGRETKGEGW